MAAKQNPTLSDWNKQGFVEVGGKLVKSDKLVAKSVDKIEPAVNKKIKGATKVEAYGIIFDSKLEQYMYEILDAADIGFEFQKTWELQPKFFYNGETVRAIKKIVDFYIPVHNIIIDTKGFSNDVSPLKHKMLKNVLKHIYDMQPEIIMPKNKKECDLLLNRLLYEIKDKH